MNNDDFKDLYNKYAVVKDGEVIICETLEEAKAMTDKNLDDTTDYGLADAKAFDQSLADNMPYNHEFYTKNKACLLNFVSYYESCKKEQNI